MAVTLAVSLALVRFEESSVMMTTKDFPGKLRENSVNTDCYKLKALTAG